LSEGSNSGLLPWIAAERAVRVVVLLAVGVVLVSNAHREWGDSILGAARHFGFDPSENGIRRVAEKANMLSPKKLVAFGIIGIGYGVLDGAEAYGLYRRRRWGEYLTVVATSLLFIPEIWELINKPSLLKVAGLVANAGIVAYLVYRLRRNE
jgi:uncharacterized membrane protein (DUF2068 family)